MIVRDVKEVARRWVNEEGHKIQGFIGAYLAGSIIWLPDNADFPASSDVDLAVVLAQSNEDAKPKKSIYHNVLLEVIYPPYEQMKSADRVLGNYHRAGGFRVSNIISDPSGNLTDLMEAVAKDYAKRDWVYRRCEDAMNNSLRFLQALDGAELYHDKVTCWLFGAGVTTHILLAAGLKNPTVRKRYMAARDLLAEYGYLDFYETLLELQGSANISRERVEHHLDALVEVFDVAKTVIKTPYRFASDISDIARPIAIDGSRELIERGFHREAVFWIVATYSRCQHVLYHDARSETQERFSVGFSELLRDLGITSSADLRKRCEQVRQHLPRVWEVAEAIMATNPEIED